MGLFVLIRAIFVRLLFACHGVISIWRLYLVSKDGRAWYISLALIGLLAETTFTIWKKKGQEWKWFCPSVFFFLLCAVPAVWFLEVHEMEKRIRYYNAGINVSSSLINLNHSVQEDLSGRIEGLGLEIRIPLKLSSDQWLRTLEQALLLFLIIGRWILPKGKLTHDQLSQLLLVYIGTAADIVEFFDAFKEEEVRYNRDLCYAILGIWAWSLLQFTMVLTATKARKDQSGVSSAKRSSPVDMDDSCCTPDVYGIIISIMMQDVPFLVLRLLLIFHYGVLSYTNMFFTCKNSLVIALLIYRLVVIQMERRKVITEARNGGPVVINPSGGSGGDLLSMSESNSNTRLIHSFYNSAADPTFDRCIKQDVRLREPVDNPNEKPVAYTIRRHLSFDDFNQATMNRRSYTNSKDQNQQKQPLNQQRHPPAPAALQFQNENHYEDIDRVRH